MKKLDFFALSPLLLLLLSAATLFSGFMAANAMITHWEYRLWNLLWLGLEALLIFVQLNSWTELGKYLLLTQVFTAAALLLPCLWRLYLTIAAV